MTRSLMVRAACAVLAAAGTATVLRAQGREPSACRAAAAQVTAGGRARDVIEGLSRCPLSGPPALAHAWQRRANPAPGELAALRLASAELRDGRLYPAVQTAALEAGRSPDVRLAALQVLASYVDSTLAPSTAYLRGAAVGDPIPRTTHAPRGSGATPLPAGRAREVAATLATLAAGDPDAVVRGAALRLRQGLALMAPGITPLAPGAIQLVAGCGPRVVLRSSADIELPVEVTVGDGTRYRRTLDVGGAAGGRPVDLLLALPPGPVTAAVGGRVVAQLAERSAPCRPGQTRG